MNKKALLSVILVILIFGSIIGMAVGTRPERPIYDDLDQNIVELPIENYYSEVQTNITEVYPEIIIASKTDVYDKSTIEKDIISVKGIKRATAEFTKLQDDSIIVIIRAVVEEKEIENIILEIEKLNYLTSQPIEFYKQGVIALKEKVLFESYEDENKTLSYDFIDRRIEAIIGIETIKGDAVKGQLQASFRGEAIDRIVFYESTNITNSPRLLVDNITLSSPEFVEEYLYSGTNDFKDKVLEAELFALLDINQGVVIKNDNKIVYNNLLKEINIEDLNTELITNIYKEEEKTTFFLKEDLSYEEYLEIINLLEENDFLKEDIIEDVKINYLITTFKKIESIENKLSSKKIELKSISQKAIFKFESLEIQGEILNYNEGAYQVWLDYPIDFEKEEYSFIAQAYATKKEILFLSLDKE